MPGKTKDSSRHSSRTHGNQKHNQQSRSEPPQAKLPAQETTDCSRPSDGHEQECSGKVKRLCPQCHNHPVHKMGLCSLCYEGHPCPSCGKQINARSTLCGSCAAKNRNNLPHDGTRMTCPTCGGKKQSGARRCLNCYRKEMIQRNVQQPEVMIRARRNNSLTGKTKVSKPHQSAKQLLDALNLQFQSEYPVGRYLVDLVIPQRNLAIEVNGSYWHNLPAAKKRDLKKHAAIREAGFSLVVLWEGQQHLWLLQLLPALSLALSSRSST